MNRVEILSGPVSLPAGCLLKLSDDQARRRAHLLTEQDAQGVYLSTAETVFKTGETFETDVVFPKTWEDRVKTSALRKRRAKNADRA